MTDKDVAAEGPRLPQQLLEIINASWMTQATYVAARLELADLLDSGPRSAEDLAAATECNSCALRQLLRALCSLGICREGDDGRFEITPMGRLLGRKSPQSVRSWALHWGASAGSVWSDLLDSVKTGVGTRERRTGKSGFEHLENDPQTARIFNQAMVELTRLISAAAARTYDFGRKRVADIGGGYGELLAAILETYGGRTSTCWSCLGRTSEARRSSLICCARWDLRLIKSAAPAPNTSGSRPYSADVVRLGWRQLKGIETEYQRELQPIKAAHRAHRRKEQSGRNKGSGRRADSWLLMTLFRRRPCTWR